MRLADKLNNKLSETFQNEPGVSLAFLDSTLNTQDKIERAARWRDADLVISGARGVINEINEIELNFKVINENLYEGDSGNWRVHYKEVENSIDSFKNRRESC